MSGDAHGTLEVGVGELPTSGLDSQGFNLERKASTQLPFVMYQLYIIRCYCSSKISLRKERHVKRKKQDSFKLQVLGQT